MTRIRVGFGISKAFKKNGDYSGGFYPMPISCFSSGVWLMNKKWLMDTKWKMNK